MIKNIYKSWITTVIGILFACADIAYLFIKQSPDRSILIALSIISVFFIFISDALAKKIINKISDKVTM